MRCCGPVFFFVPVSLLTLLQACYHPENIDFCRIIPPVVSESTQPPTVVFEDPGTIKVMHNSGCGHLDKNKGFFFEVEQSIDIPDYANKAAVFLNGWKLKYSGGDHHVNAVGSALGKIKLEPPRLTWSAVGVLGDYGGGKAIDWCDWYTVVAWNDTKLRAFVDQGNARSVCENFFFAPNNGTTTALSCFPSFLFNSNFASGSNVAVLPRGFVFDWRKLEDHHLLQMAYNLEHSEPLLQSLRYDKEFVQVNPLPTPPTGRVDSGFVSWNTYGIYKDNDARRDYRMGELVSGMGGPDVGVIQPPFSVLPHEGMGFFGACLGSPAGVQTEDVVIDNIPYAYAIPMLTGWNLEYPCNDHHVREVGIWIDDLHYDRNPNAPTGTLRCKVSSLLHDDSSNWGSYSHKVTILGLRPLATATHPPVKETIP